MADVVPLVSCLMVTTDRLTLAKRSIRCFINQTYSRLELVIVCAGDRAYRRALEHHLEYQGIGNARVIAAGRRSTLGALRNLSLDAAAGDIVCQWDDDDYHHSDRVLRQVEHMTRQGARACFLTDNLHLLEPDRQMFWVDWTRGTSKKEQWWQLSLGTVMRIRDERFRYAESGPRAYLGEDFDLAADLCREVPVATLNGMGWLYVYVFHGRNTCSKEHHYAIPARRSFPNEWIEARCEELRRAVDEYAIPRPVDVCGAGGPVFRLA
ncbi:Glycosyltransferase involved in cell wall bisynthesis [Saccharopolyspora antimicrobica]|uniref:Glycosyltransferase involved in cell wall biosynthesis n=1 Tax=Saccharopolyspora antimicrobica TaxID=455193 RepID=A0A1I4W3S9_9PSEU|nr:glycosyltransferase [Saccharopolyspora antimicrobica]RKT87099.1 glycosyltransferase involved in cell wall biosynthesis [Saccharopolyspora antimicrobica]SFN07689.1 Glycosyltransferase involved in cell wall bisynthesis [Saccharopolyspora antimicrobica]